MSVTAINKAEGDQEAKPAKKNPADLYKFWTKEKDAAEKRLRSFTKQGNFVVRRFLDEREGKNDSQSFEGYLGDTPSRLNLFHTNVATMQSMLYGSIPKIEASREHQDPDDDVARVASVLYQRILEADVQTSGDDLATCFRSALQDRLLPGMGVARVRYDYESEKRNVLNPETLETTPTEFLTDEFCHAEYVHWQDFLWGWARTWAEVPWVGYRAWMTKTEAIARFGQKKAAKLEYKNQMPSGGDTKDEIYDKDQRNNVQKAEIWEFWHKGDKRVYWYSKGVELILDTVQDPLGLDGFYPSPAPMMANLTTSLFVPRADYVISQDLYNEIDELQSRIATITRAVKVVGVYDESAGGSVGRMLKEGVENDLIPVENWAMFAEKGGLDGSIDWFPVQEVVGTLMTLVQIQDGKIEQLYQITGMSDILRGGNTDQYAAASTQAIKAKMGSVRVQSLQDQFARFASDLAGLKCEVISKHFSPESIAVQSNAEFMPEFDQPLIPPAMQLMKSPVVKWRIDIRPESIAMVDYAQLKSERTEFLMGIATFIQSAAPMTQSVPGSMPFLLEMLKWGMAGFKGSNYLEGMMDKAIEMAKQAPPGGGEEEQRQQEQQAEQQRARMEHQFEMERIQAKAAADTQVQQTKFEGEIQKAMADHQAKMEQQQAKSQGDMAKIMADLRADLQIIATKLEADLAVEEAQSTFAAAEEELEHDNTMKEKAKDGQMAAVQQDRQTDSD